MARPIKPVRWVGSSKKDLGEFPKKVQQVFGYALWRTQLGEQHRDEKMLKGFRGKSILEIAADWGGSTYRLIYTVQFPDVVYVLHAFQKKSTKGIKTPLREIDLVHRRLRIAEQHYAQWKDNKEERN